MHKLFILQTGAWPMPQNSKPKRNKRAYLNDFHQTLSGEYVYQGATYTFEGSKKERMHLYYKLLAIGAVLAAAGVTSGCITAPGTLNCFYVLIPYMAAFLASASLIWGLCRLWAGGSPLRDYLYQATLDQFQTRGMLTAICAGCAIVGEIVYVIRNGSQGLVSGMILFLLCQAVTVAGSLLWIRTTENSCWVKNEAVKPKAE